jgi:hypothetical protein
MKNIQLSILFIALACLWACSENHPSAPSINPDAVASASPASSGGTGGTGDSDGAILPGKLQVIENCRLLQAAADEFAARNGGIYPANLIDVTPQGHTVADLLPGGALANPFTRAQESPREGVADAPGEVGYLAVFKDNRPRGYVITGAGAAEGIRIVSVVKSVAGTVTESIGRKTPGLDDKVLDNCLIVQKAAEAYAAGNSGEYAERFDEANLEGNTLIDLLPGSALLTNPSTGAPTEPVYWGPSGLGSTSYWEFTYWDHGIRVFAGYRIVGRGEIGDIIITNEPEVTIKDQAVIKNCLLVRDAAEQWAADNDDGNYYPANTGHQNTLGKLLVDYLVPPLGGLLVNPYTDSPTEPVNGGPASRGSTGYLPCDRNADGYFDGYVIDGLGVDAAAQPVYRINLCW